MVFDLLILGGELVDPTSGRRGRFDVAVRDGRVAAVEPSLAHVAAAQVVDATGLYVTPGLVDLHTHVYWGVTYWGIQPDSIAAQSGVTTWVDAGSAGAYTVSGLHDFVVKASQVGIYAFLNIATIGLVHPTHELALLEYCDVQLCRRMSEQHAGLIRGIKVRMGADTVGRNGIEPLVRARQSVDALNLPPMVHLYASPPDVSSVLDLLRPGGCRNPLPDRLRHASGGRGRSSSGRGSARRRPRRADGSRARCWLIFFRSRRSRFGRRAADQRHLE